MPYRQTAEYGSRPSLRSAGTTFVTALTRNRAGNSEVGRMMAFLTALGQDVRITVKPTKKRVGEMEVVVGRGACRWFDCPDLTALRNLRIYALCTRSAKRMRSAERPPRPA